MKKQKMSLIALIGLTIAFFGSVRTVPVIADTGWSMILYLLIAALGFALPIALMSAELSTTFEGHGGASTWVTNALGERWGFMTSWLLWVQMFFGMAMVGSTVGALVGYVIGKPEIGENALLVFIILLGTYWLLTLLNLKFDMTKIQGSYGAVIGIYLPFVVLIVLGVMYLCKHGIASGNYLDGFTAAKLIPDFSNLHALPVLTGIIFIFAGVEMSSVHVSDIKNPSKNYPIAVISAVVIVVLLELGGAFTMANAVPQGKMELSNIMHSLNYLVVDAGLPDFVDEVLAGCILIGTLVTMSSWVLGPSKTMFSVAKQGNLPKVFQKTNARGLPVVLMIVQASFVSLIALLFLIIPNVNEVFLIINVTTMLLYCVVYLLIAVSAIRLRYTMPNQPRAFRIGKRGNGAMWIVSALALVVTVLTMLIGLIVPEGLSMSAFGYVMLQMCIVLLFAAVALVTYKCRKASWKTETGEKNAEEI
ncbi:MAG: amino acid permease [Ruthenibacterium sp.]